MIITNPYVTFEMIVENSHFNFTSPCNQSFADVSLLGTNGKENEEFITSELNKTILNSEYKTIDNIRHPAFVSNILSDSNCMFNGVYVLAEQINHQGENFYALSLDFGDNFPKKIRVVYASDYNLNNCETIVDNIDSSSIIVDMQANSVSVVYIYFLESWAPFRYAYLQEVNFGVIYNWDNNDIVDLTVTEETPLFCTTLPVDKSKLTVYLPQDQFSMINNRNALDYITKDQKFKIHETIENTETGEVKDINFGVYYLEDISNENDHKVTFELSNILGKLDKKDFFKSEMYVGDVSAYDVILDILFEANISSDEVEIDENLKGEVLQGYIPIMSCREALQQVLFVTKSLLYDNRYDKIKIKKIDYTVNQIVKGNEIFYPYEIKQENTVARISYEYFSYFKNFLGKETLAKISVNSMKPLTINFDKPIDEYTIEVNAFVLWKYALCARIMPLINSRHDITIKATTYLEVKHSDETNYGIEENIKKYNINGVKLLNVNNANDIVSSLSDFNSKSITYKIEYLCTGQETGYYTKFILGESSEFITSDNKEFGDSNNKDMLVINNSIVGYLKYQTIDLAHGMVAKAEIVLKK